MSGSNKNKRRNGIGPFYTLTLLVGVCGVATLGVDLGRVRLTKSQLRNTCESSALVAAELLSTDPAAAKQAAIDAANANFADGARVSLQSDDVRFINWDESSRTYEVLDETNAAEANAILVTAYRNELRQNPVRLPFAQLVGHKQVDVSAHAIALASPKRYAVLGLDYVSLGGEARIAPANGETLGGIASNGAITLSQDSSIAGDAYVGNGEAVIGEMGLTGSAFTLATPVKPEAINPGNAIKENGNARINWLLEQGRLVLAKQSKARIPAGTYFLNGISLGGGSELCFTGPATVYVTGGIELAANSVICAHTNDLKIIVLGAGPIALHDNVSLHADLLAPQAAIEMGSGSLRGALTARSIALSGNAAIYYDLNTRAGVRLVD